ncbi:GGDEF domain-containing protein [Mycolicibacterium palauense]|uniref:GGDEF domain-containing protein n=1 Tax=Mycolicibacterium palauense TaxID=2034511 RepID=UPI001FE2BF61|nr:GGDEF domain-containing protein [Mycolicibacterium palauense]
MFRSDTPNRRGEVRGDLQSFQVFGRLVGEWWREPVDYSAYVQYFAKRSMTGAIRVMIGVGIGLISIITLVVLLPAVQPASMHPKIVVALFAVLNAYWAVVWCTRPWPTRRQSRAFIIASDLGIAAVGLTGSSWLMGLFALNCFALISVYLMFFDGPKALTLHTLLILATTVAFITLASADDVVGGAFTGRILGAVVPVIATPLGIQFGIRTLRNDANASATDPLTGLLNRRGLHLHFSDLLEHGSRATGGTVSVVVIDLDRFKNINDTHGHAVGDQVLVRCSQLITQVVSGRGLIARVGGEEFVAVVLGARASGEKTAEAIRREVAASGGPPAITASVGVTSVNRSHFIGSNERPQLLLEAAIARADQAMFCAKRSGGNTTHQF